MRAAVLRSAEDGKLVVQDDVTAVGPGPGQMRVAVKAAGVCHSDLSARDGGLPSQYPAILGHEAAGEVVAVGEGVTGIADHPPGDRVRLALLTAESVGGTPVRVLQLDYG